MALPNPNIHRVVITFDDGVRAKLICPESGCVPPHSCGSCGRSFDDTEIQPCYDCSDLGSAPTECWVKSWFDNLSAEELLKGTITVEVDPEWDGDSLVAHIVGVIPTDHPDATQADPQAEGPSTINPAPPSSSSTGEDHGGAAGLDSDGSPTAPDGLAAGAHGARGNHERLAMVVAWVVVVSVTMAGVVLFAVGPLGHGYPIIGLAVAMAGMTLAATLAVALRGGKHRR